MWKDIWSTSSELKKQVKKLLLKHEQIQKLDNFSIEEWVGNLKNCMSKQKVTFTDLFKMIDKNCDGVIDLNDFVSEILHLYPSLTSVSDLERIWSLMKYQPKSGVKLNTFVEGFKILSETFGNSNIRRLVRITPSSAMIRVGGGWLTLEEFLQRYDPCRCNINLYFLEEIMGLSMSKKYEKFYLMLIYCREITITLIGNANAGKTILSKRIKGDKFSKTVPTIGIQRLNFVSDKVLININDIGGNSSIMKIWENYYPESFGIIYVIDSEDRKVFENSILQLKNILNHSHVVDKPILIVLNKCELDHCLCSEEVETLININEYKNIFMTECSCSVNNNHPLYKLLLKNFKIFINEISSNYEILLKRINVDKQSLKTDVETKIENNELKDQVILGDVPVTFIRRSTLFETVKKAENLNDPVNTSIPEQHDEKIEKKVTIAEIDEDIAENNDKYIDDGVDYDIYFYLFNDQKTRPPEQGYLLLLEENFEARAMAISKHQTYTAICRRRSALAKERNRLKKSNQMTSDLMIRVRTLNTILKAREHRYKCFEQNSRLPANVATKPISRSV
ncbi:uncharacterized protein LOC115229449 [Octopus sinensis]|uniref:Uncharacterized protein LOC115229449 n=1 Tax=Octopus sinensis TaxID=2607531 RepID=A0A7E6EJU3_9MOLL|nr:uncharacterized protein LOC115229449 [Octopus sinensis]